jgi:hypothetical protein
VREVGEPVKGDETLWKYFRLDRFLSTLKESRLYFASANEFEDPFEGAVAVHVNAPPPDPRYAEMEFTERAFFQLRRLTKISCWHRAAYESDAMWKNKALVWHPLEETLDGETVKFYAEAEDVLSHLPKLGVPMIMRRIQKGSARATPKCGPTLAWKKWCSRCARRLMACRSCSRLMRAGTAA